jgi:uncharacterized protein
MYGFRLDRDEVIVINTGTFIFEVIGTMYVVAKGLPTERAEFIRKTYTHLSGAVAAFIGVEFFLFQSGIAGSIAQALSSNRNIWLLVLGGFALLGWMSRELASRADSISLQYSGLGLYVVGEALIFAPLIYIANVYAPNAIPAAAIMTGLLFAGLTTVVFTTGKDFSFLGGALKICGSIAIGLIICSILFSFSLGILFSFLMVAFAAASILYDTSRIMHHYSKDQYVAASLELFASVALLFWYILRIMMELSRR